MTNSKFAYFVCVYVCVRACYMLHVHAHVSVVRARVDAERSASGGRSTWRAAGSGSRPCSSTRRQATTTAWSASSASTGRPPGQRRSWRRVAVGQLLITWPGDSAWKTTSVAERPKSFTTSYGGTSKQRTRSEPAILSIVERSSSFGGSLST